METASSSTSVAFGALETAEKLTAEQIEERANRLLEQLSLDEKIWMMDGDYPFWEGFPEMMGGGYAAHTWVAGEVPRLGIPGIRFADGPRGVVLKGATTFPVSMARGASWDTELEERVGDVIGRELRALGGNFFGGVCINLLRHPGWGRAQETYGEDTYHLGVFGEALTLGVQRHVMACVKHYALNSMENARFTIDVKVEPRALQEVYLAHFRRVVQAGVASVMSSYNSVNGEWAGQNPELLNDILKQDWGFDGFVMTDFMWGMRDAKKAALAGQDLEMPFQNLYNLGLKSLVEQGEVPLERVNDACRRLLRQQIRFGQGRNPQDYTPEVVGNAENRQLAREAAEKSIVLLKNEGAVLPLKDVRRMAVIGRLAEIPNTGDGGSSRTQPAYVVTPLQGLREALGHEAVTFDDGQDAERAANLAREADVAVVVVGFTHEDEGEYSPRKRDTRVLAILPEPTTPLAAQIVEALREGKPRPGQKGGFSPGGDRERLSLRPEDEALILKVVEANPRTVVVMMAGSAVITEAWRQQAPAIVMLWYPGMEGGRALADVLLGRVNPGGRLPCTFPVSTADLPFFDRQAEEITYDLWHGYRKFARDGATPAFPFGFGLSYTTFACANLRLSSDQIGSDGTLEVTVDLTNTGTVKGDEVVQLYISVPGSKIERAPQELKAFKRVTLEPGETRSVTLQLPGSELAYYDAASSWVVEPGEYEVSLARHAHDQAALKASFQVR
ncbi:MAG: Beta-glucosidase [Chloroflexi bacterium]|jgi:beta-glucosidase|nr:Beta-glucosidase [Chloroflexota bacterium]